MKYIIDTDKLPCNNGKNCTTCPFWSVDDTCEITEQVKKLPKYEDRPHGEWKYAIVDCYKSGYICPHCNGFAVIDGKSDGYSVTFCPNCGSDNRKRGEAE